MHRKDKFLAAAKRKLSHTRRRVAVAVLSWARCRPSKRDCLLGVAALAAIAGTVVGLVRFEIDTNTEAFLPAGDPTVAALEDKARSFGGDPVVAILESPKPRQFLTDKDQLPRLLGLEGKLAQLPDVANVYGPATVLNQIATSAQSMLARISGMRDAIRTQAEQVARDQGLSAAQIQARGDQAVANFERRYGSLLVKGLPAGLPTLHNPNFAERVIYDRSGQPRPQWHFVVPNANNISVLVRPREGLDQSSTQQLVSSIRSTINGVDLKTTRLTVTGVPVLSAGLADEVGEELPLLAVLVGFAMLVRFLLVPSPAAGRLQRLWPLLAAIIGTALTLSTFGWLGHPMSLGAVALLPLLLGIGSSFPLYLRTLTNKRRVIVVSFASAAGFAALTTSPLPFVRELGLAIAIGVVLTVMVALTFSRTGIARAETIDVDLATQTRKPATAFVRWTTLTCAALVAGIGWLALPNVDVEADPRELAHGLPELNDAKYAEQIMGSSGEISIVVRGVDVLSPEVLRWARQAEESIIVHHAQHLRPVLTTPGLLSFLGESPTADQITSGMNVLPTYLTNAVVRPDGQESLLTFGLKLQDIREQTKLLNEVRDSLPAAPEGVQVDIVGFPVAANKGYELLTNHRYLANLGGIVAAGFVLVLGLRRRRDALPAVLASGLAAGWALAGVWIVDGALSPLTIALGSLTAVTACEFTVLLADAYRRRQAWLRRAVAWACVTSAAGYLALVPSKLWLLREFGIVLTATALLSYLAAVVVLWSLPPTCATRTPRFRSSALKQKEVPA